LASFFESGPEIFARRHKRRHFVFLEIEEVAGGEGSHSFDLERSEPAASRLRRERIDAGGFAVVGEDVGSSPARSSR